MQISSTEPKLNMSINMEEARIIEYALRTLEDEKYGLDAKSLSIEIRKSIYSLRVQEIEEKEKVTKATVDSDRPQIMI